MHSWSEKIQAQWSKKNYLCIGLDPDRTKLPLQRASASETITAFNCALIDAIKDSVAAYKPNTAFYEAYGEEGWTALKATCDYIRSAVPEVAIILDAKRGDIGTTNEGYVQMAFDFLKADAITVQPYLGGEALRPFLEHVDKGIIVLCKTSNQGSAEFQNIVTADGPLYIHVAKRVAHKWNENNNCALVIGATYIDELQAVREATPDIPLLIPGIGAQGGDLGATVRAGARNMIIAISRSIIYASQGPDFAEAARAEAQKYHSAIQEALVQ